MTGACIGRLGRAGELARVNGTLNSAGKQMPSLAGMPDLTTVARRINTSGIGAALAERPLQPSLMASLGSLSLLSGLIRHIHSAFDIHLLSPGGARALTGKLGQLSMPRLGLPSLSGGPKTPPWQTALLRLSPSILSLRAAGIDPVGPEAAAKLRGWLDSLHGKGLTAGMGAPQVRSIGLGHLTGVSTFASAIGAIAHPNGLGVNLLGASGPKDLASKMSLFHSSPTQQLLSSAAAGKLTPALQGAEGRLQLYKAKMARIAMVRSATGIDMTAPGAEAKAAAFLKSMKASGLCRELRQAPAAGAGQAELARVDSMCGALRSTHSNLDVDCTHPDGARKLKNTLNAFMTHAEPTVSRVSVAPEALAGATKLAQLATVSSLLQKG